MRIFAKAINSVSNGTGDVTVADIAVFTECQAPSGDNGTYYQMNADGMSTFDTSLQRVMNTSMAMVNVFILIIKVVTTIIPFITILTTNRLIIIINRKKKKIKQFHSCGVLGFWDY